MRLASGPCTAAAAGRAAEMVKLRLVKRTKTVVMDGASLIDFHASGRVGLPCLVRQHGFTAAFTVSFAGFSRDCLPFAQLLPQRIKNGRANRQAELSRAE